MRGLLGDKAPAHEILLQENCILPIFWVVEIYIYYFVGKGCYLTTEVDRDRFS